MLGKNFITTRVQAPWNRIPANFEEAAWSGSFKRSLLAPGRLDPPAATRIADDSLRKNVGLGSVGTYSLLVYLG